jgi:hypothetical protein
MNTKGPCQYFQSQAAGNEEEEIVQISEEELRELVEKAGGTIEVRDPSTIRRKRAPGRLNAAPFKYARLILLNYVGRGAQRRANRRS